MDLIKLTLKSFGVSYLFSYIFFTPQFSKNCDLKTIPENSLVFVEKLTPSKREMKVGDVISFKTPFGNYIHSIKRVKGIGGDIVNGNHIPIGFVWVESDLNFCSYDSRIFGAIPISLVEGRVLLSLSKNYPNFKIQKINL
eukprot:TRINITY_DN3171_c0_g2_i1.p1 TRINITY_DN3171_c0_g2~~TRINITY_DN3171_c0_g2_i1.p1  ORF type:complete len:140 (+),score=31.72 TRINITY_DN3171_c0_g2_i1:130-549(+)